MARQQKTPKMALLEAQDANHRSIENILRDAYVQAGSQAAAADSLGISRALFNQWFHRLGVDQHKEGTAS